MVIKLTADAFSWHSGNSGEWMQFRTKDGQAHKAFEELVKDGTYDITITRHREKRSMSANAYAWTLIDKIAVAMHLKKSDVYRTAVREIGGNSVFLRMQEEAYEKFKRDWENGRLGYQVIRLNGKVSGCADVVAYYGSSAYDTEQMSRLIESLVQDAKELGIETMTPEELSRLEYEE